MKVVVAIDPSINFCGYAIYVNNIKWVLYSKGLIKPDKSITDEVEKASNIYEKCKKLIDDISLIDGYRIGECSIVLVVENPAHWKVGGYVARESGNIQKLILLVGKLSTLINNTVLVHPHEWKGQCPKPVTRARMVRRLERFGADKLANYVSICNHNVLDAIGIGYWYIFLKDKKKMV